MAISEIIDRVARCVAINTIVIAGGGSSRAMAFERPPETAWTRQLGTGSADRANGVSVDSAGNSYITGRTQGSLNGPNAGSSDVFLAKYSSTGSLLWKRQIGTSNSDQAYGVVVDSTGNVYITGFTFGSLGGSNVGSSDLFLAKYSSTGTLLWTRQFGTSGVEEAHGIASDGAGNVYVSGFTSGALGGSNAGSFDAFLSKYSATGTLIWTRQLGTSSGDYGQWVALDNTGNAFIAGQTNGSLGGPNAGSSDAFLAKYTTNGSLLWKRQFGTANLDPAYGVAVDSAGNAFITGETGSGLSGIGWDAFLAKYSAAGTLLWTRQLAGGSFSDSGYGVAVDGSGDVYMCGDTHGSWAGPNAGEGDAFVAKYSAAGSLLWTRQIGSSSSDWASHLAIDLVGNAYLSGYTYGGLGALNAGSDDAFLIKLGTEPLVIGDINGDSLVNTDDLLLLLGAWGACAPPPLSCPPDLNHSGNVNTDDLLIVIANWG